jgi:hypothetical protein
MVKYYGNFYSFDLEEINFGPSYGKQELLPSEREKIYILCLDPKYSFMFEIYEEN